MVRDGSSAFVGSQSLRKLELDNRREVGVIVSDTAIAKRMQEVFESDWLKTMSKAEVRSRRQRQRQEREGGEGKGEKEREIEKV